MTASTGFASSTSDRSRQLSSSGFWTPPHSTQTSGDRSRSSVFIGATAWVRRLLGPEPGTHLLTFGLFVPHTSSTAARFRAFRPKAALATRCIVQQVAAPGDAAAVGSAPGRSDGQARRGSATLSAQLHSMSGSPVSSRAGRGAPASALTVCEGRAQPGLRS
jgi:hypothetical protein